MAAASNVIPLGLLYMRPLQGWYQGSCLRAGAGSSLSPHNASDRRVPHRLGSRHPVKKKGRGRGPGNGCFTPKKKTGGPLRYSGKYTVQCPLWYSLIHPAPLGLDAMVQTWPRLRLYVFPRSLCSRVFWRECAGTRSEYLW